MKKKPVDKIVFDGSSLCNSHKDAVSRNFEVMEKKNLEKIEKKKFQDFCCLLNFLRK